MATKLFVDQKKAFNDAIAPQAKTIWGPALANPVVVGAVLTAVTHNPAFLATAAVPYIAEKVDKASAEIIVNAAVKKGGETFNTIIGNNKSSS